MPITNAVSPDGWKATVLDRLAGLRAHDGVVKTKGISDETILSLAAQDPRLEQAVDLALLEAGRVAKEFPGILDLDETEQVRQAQDGFLNFYPFDNINPYLPLGATGPWIVTSKGAVLHDNGGYGMLGFGHAPQLLLEAMNKPHVMANVMTANVSQMRLLAALRREIGYRRGTGCPYAKFLFLNSGSESVSLGARISDVNAKLMTDPGGRHAGKAVRRLSLCGGFHGRTGRPAQFSDSCKAMYREHLASFQGTDTLFTVTVNDRDALSAAFADAERDGVFIEALFMEPVMGEGNPGMAVTPAFYGLARQLCTQNGALLLVDSIQAGLRANGCLSIVDYPGFEALEAPDMETYSKALNGGQFPLSVLAVNDKAAALFRTGLYGNTMTSNPRAMDVAVAVLEMMTPALRQNIVDRGQEFLEKLSALKDELDGPITKAQGTGLLASIELTDEFKSYGENSIEEYLRHHGIGVIHGGRNSLRFTPCFAITSAELDMIVAATRDAILHGPRVR